MHGSDAGLGSVSKKNKDERQPHGRLVKLGGVSGEDGPIQTRQRVRAKGAIGGIVGENRAKQRHRKADAADDRIFPRCLKRGVTSIKHDQEHRRQGGPLDRYPENSQVVGERYEHHGENQEGH
jgi:hypothetical protein